MSKPTILTVDDDPLVAAAIATDLARQYGADYRIVRASSGSEALAALAKLALRDVPVALIAADQRMPRMTGIEMLQQSRAHAPGAKLLLLKAYADTDVAIQAINDIGLDYYLLKPWDPPEERLYPVIDDLLGDWRRANPDQTSDVRVVGHRWSDRSYEIKMFLTRNHVPYRCTTWSETEAPRLVDLAEAAPSDLPLVLVPDGDTLRSPSTLDAAGALGLHTTAQQQLYDVCIVGGGPAGLAAGVYAASEGLSTVIVEREDPGGQAGLSAAIENHLGFPKGLSGSDLAHRALVAAKDDGHLEVLTLADRDSGVTEEVPSSWLFVFIGPRPARRSSARTWCATRRGSSSPARSCWMPSIPSGGRSRGRRTCSRRACPGSSPPATYGSTP